MKRVPESPRRMPVQKPMPFSAGLSASGSVPFLLLLLSLASCSTLPEAPYLEILGRLPSDSSLVMRFEVPGNRALADLFLSALGTAARGADDDAVQAVLDRTALLAVGIEYSDALGISDNFSPFSGRAIHLAALGRWPRAFIGAALPASWRKVEAGRWEDDGGTALAAVSREEILISAGRLDEMMRRRERGARAAPLSGGMPMVPKSDLMIRIVDTGLIDALIPLLSGRIEGIELVLKAVRESPENEADAYSASVSLYPSDARLVGPLVLALRIAVASRFGLSPYAEERDLLSGVSVDAVSGLIWADFPAMSLGVLGRFAETWTKGDR